MPFFYIKAIIVSIFHCRFFLHVDCFALLHLAKHFNSWLFSVGLKPYSRQDNETIDTELRRGSL